MVMSILIFVVGLLIVDSERKGSTYIVYFVREN